ncbi:MAG: riboflavin biosynthesis protein RibF, partial [Vulcanimicrobiaceae bacterium]
MRIYHELQARATDAPPIALAIGFFDGLHRGHREIVRALLRLRRPGMRAAVLTFGNHPATHLRPQRVPPLIATTEERIDLLAAAGIDELYLVPFDERIAQLAPREFLEEIVLERLQVRALVVGENFRFGRERAGDATLARELLGANEIPVVAVAPLQDGDERVSSTRIREAILRGDLATANRLLGAPYELRGRVVLGAGRGHALGFPTANLAVAPEKLLPADGVYAMLARYDGRDHPGLVSIGTNPTYDGRARTIEAWLRDFRGTIYGHELALRDFAFVREQRRFASPEELRLQMQADAAQVRFPS